MRLILKLNFIFLFFLLVYKYADAQKATKAAAKDTTMYYLSSAGKVVSTKDSAEYFLLILPPDTSADKNLFIVKELYINGKIRLIGSSTTNNLDLKFEGPQITFFPNGRRMRIMNFVHGELLGDVTEYYPNGKFYHKKNYFKPNNKDLDVLLKNCNDSTGKVLAENGKGKWIKFLDESFKNAYIEGEISNGWEDGEWRGKRNDSVNLVWVYKKGELISAKTFDLKGKDITYDNVQGSAEFPGGSEKMNEFINRNLKYPQAARKNGTQGVVVVNFDIEADGTLTNFKVAKSIGDDCDEEALRILKIVPKWFPGMRNGKHVKTSASVPISFVLKN